MILIKINLDYYFETKSFLKKINIFMEQFRKLLLIKHNFKKKTYLRLIFKINCK
jgi:hypothetical protein